MVTGSRELIREMNRRLVLETVINDGPLSRAAISKKLGLTKATISAIVQDLLEEQYIEEIGSDQTQYGRKPILLQFCRQNGYIIALDLGVERTVLMVCDLLGQNCRLHQYNCPLERDTSINFLLQLIRNQIRLLPATPFGVVGIGIGIHGTVCRNEITFTPNYNLADLPIKDTLEDALEIPVWLENEANLSALAEKTFVENHKNLIHVSIHAGVGADYSGSSSVYRTDRYSRRGRSYDRPARRSFLSLRQSRLSRTIYIRTGSSLPLPGVIRPHHGLNRRSGLGL